MVLAHLLFFLPALVWSSIDSVSIVPAEDLKVCEYLNARIIRLGEVVSEELRPDVDVDSELYNTLEESKLCDTVGYVAIPECVANNEGDECVARKTSEMITRTFSNAMEVKKIKEVPSGEKFFATCKHIGYKNVLKTFKSARSLMSAECGLPGQKLGNRHARNADLLPALLLAGSYDPSSIWFQYFLCKDIDLYCYFFTQGWTQGQYGQYYLYDNLLDDTTGLFAGSTDSNLATIALLGGLGGGIGQPSGYYPSYGAPAAAPSQGRKRREAGRAVDCQENPTQSHCRNRRSLSCDEDPAQSHCRNRRSLVSCDEDPTQSHCRNRRSLSCDDDPNQSHCRNRRSLSCDDDPNQSHCRNRRSNCDGDSDHPDCKRKRRQVCEDDDDDNCRKRRRACEACEKNPDSTECKEC